MKRKMKDPENKSPSQFINKDQSDNKNYMYHTKHDKWITDKHVHLPLKVLTCANLRICKGPIFI